MVGKHLGWSMGLVFIRGYLREYARITLASIKAPRKFFEEVKSEDKNYSKPFAYMFISNTVFIAAFGLGLSYLANRHGNFNLLDHILEKFVPFYIVLAVLFFVYVALMQLAIKLVRGKGSLDKTFMVICYSFSPINFASWLFFLAFTENIYASSSFMALPFWLGLLASILYIFYIIVVGISITYEISGSRAFAALMIQLFIFALIPTILTSVSTFLYQYDEDTPLSYYPRPSITPAYEKYSTPAQNPYSKNDSSGTPIESYKPETAADSFEPEPIKYDITVFAGSTPIIDGIKDGKDAWYEGESIRKAYGVDDLTITVKHDFENIYILMELDGQPGSFNQIAMYFEQDKNFPDHNLTSGLVDNYYLAFFAFENSLSDRHYQFGSGYGSNEPQNATSKGVYKDGISIMEWQIPMKSGDVHDIYVNEFPTQVGFSIIDWKNWREGPRGIWPPNALPSKPETWGTMTIVGEKAR